MCSLKNPNEPHYVTFPGKKWTNGYSPQMGNKWWIKVIMPLESNLASQYIYWNDLKAWVNSKTVTSLQSPLTIPGTVGECCNPGASCTTCRQLSRSEPLLSAATNTVDIILGGAKIIICHSPYPFSFCRDQIEEFKRGEVGTNTSTSLKTLVIDLIIPGMYY